ncbi:MAG: GGDEF domain-containing protein [Wenzhouxiangella sp.]|nr:MAG: GGDEF domain-containing protein [Wenzhouxiangella sp.]
MLRSCRFGSQIPEHRRAGKSMLSFWRLPRLPSGMDAVKRWLSGLLLSMTGIFPVMATLPPLPAGLPPVQEIELPSSHDSTRLDLLQGHAGVLHLATGSGVATYDGRRWNTWNTPNHAMVRSLALDDDGRLFIGGQELFGYLQADVSGQWHFTDLSADFAEALAGEPFDQIWDILLTPDGVLFNADHHLFLVDPDGDRRKLWQHSGRFGAQVLHAGEVLVQFRGVGLKRLVDDEFELIEGGEQLVEQIYMMLPLATGGLLLTRRDSRWMHFSEGRLEDWPMPPGMPGSAEIGDAEVLDDGSLALGGMDGRLHIYHPTTGNLRSFRVANDFILAVRRSHHGGLFVQTMSRTLHVAWPSQWLRVGSESGLSGSLMKITLWDDRWLTIGSTGALASTRPDDPDWTGRVEFKPTDWSAFEAWAWLDLGDRVLFANSYQLLEISQAGVRSLSDDDLYAKSLLASRYEPGRIYVGTDYGLAVLERVDEDWRWTFRQDELLGVVTSLVEMAPGELLLSATSAGVIRAQFSPDHSELLAWEKFDETQGLQFGNDRLAWIGRSAGDQVVVSTAAGFFQWLQGSFEPTDLDGLDGLRLDESPVALKTGPNGTSWAFSDTQVWRRPNAGEWISEEVNRLAPGPVSSLNFIGDTVVLGGTGTLLTFDDSVPSPQDQAPGIRLTGVLRRDRDQTREERLPLDGSDLVFPQLDDYFVFEYAVPEYRRPDMVRIRYRLLGWEERFTDWGQSSRVTFSRLRPGHYRFEAEARDPDGNVSRIQPFEFVIQAPWHRTRWAWAIWVVVGLSLLALLIGFLTRLRLRRAWAEQSRLAAMVEQRTAELAAANRKLRSLAHIDGLTAIANRRRFEEYLEEAWRNCAERGRELAIIILDVDHFKAYNDTHGHQAGDDALREVADIASDGLRRSEDLVARYGGEEFICVLPGANLETALEVAEQIRSRVEQSDRRLTASLGVASQVPDLADMPRVLIERADKALYRAKQAGRNRVAAAD